MQLHKCRYYAVNNFIDGLFVLCSAKTCSSVDNLDIQLSCSLHNSNALLCTDVVGNLA